MVAEPETSKLISPDTGVPLDPPLSLVIVSVSVYDALTVIKSPLRIRETLLPPLSVATVVT